MRTRREDNVPTVLLQGRVAPESRKAVNRAAKTSGMTTALYLDSLITVLKEDGNGELPDLSYLLDASKQEQLPMDKP